MYKVVPKKQSVNSTYSCSKPRERRLLQLPSGTRVRAHVHVLPGICEKREKKISYMWAAELSLGPSLFLPWQWKQIQLTLISVFSQTLYVWEKASLCPHSIKAWSLPLLNMLIHLAPPPPHALSLRPIRPPLPHSPFPSRQKGDLGYFSVRIGGPGLHPPGWLCGVERRREKERLHAVIPLTIPVPYGERTGLSSGTVRGVAGPACLSNRGTCSLRLGLVCCSQWGLAGAETTRIVQPEYDLIIRAQSVGVDTFNGYMFTLTWRMLLVLSQHWVVEHVQW